MAEETLAQRVRRLRNAKGLSQDALGRAVEMTRQHVYDIERGETKTMLWDTIVRYAEALDVEPQYLMTGELPGGQEIPAYDVFLRSSEDLPEEDVKMLSELFHVVAERRRLERQQSGES